jgi:diaminopimelate decarboxylase
MTNFLNQQKAASLIQQFGSPLYVYDEKIIRQRAQELANAFSGWKKTRLFYACKANNNPHILRIIREEGAGLDCVSIYEVELGLHTGFSPSQIIFTVNNMSDEEMHYAQNKKILLNIDSLSRLEKYGRAYPHSNVCIRLTPEVIAGHHKKVQTGHKECKFGILREEIPEVLRIMQQYHLRIIGLHEHTGSGIKNMSVTFGSMRQLMQIALQFPNLQFLDFGGGFPVPYNPQEKRIHLQQFGKQATQLFKEFCIKYGRELNMYFEPGRYYVAEAGILLCTVTTLKQRGSKTFVGVNTGFHHLIRPVMYDSYHHITNTRSGLQKKYSIFGNTCESGDCFGRDRMLSLVHEGDILAIHTTGAYGFSMASQYNSRALPAEVLISHSNARVIRNRETFKDIIRNVN